MKRQPRFVVAQRDAGWIARLEAANGKIIMSSGPQMYAERRDAIRAITLAVEAVGHHTEVIGDVIVTRPKYVDERTKP